MKPIQRKKHHLSGSKTPVHFDGKTFAPTLEAMLTYLTVRVQSIIRARYGLGGNKPETLEKIGRTYGITRERVRQIIRGAVRDMALPEHTETLDALGEYVIANLEKHHGIMTEEALYTLLVGDDSREVGALRFFIENFVPIRAFKETATQEASLAVRDFPLDEWQELTALVTTLFETLGHSLTQEELVLKVAQHPRGKYFQDRLLDFIAVSRNIKRSVFGQWGLVEWSDILPKGAREKAYLILKSLVKPLHFREIAELIDQYKLQKSGRVTHFQTVHNELIKDKRFVLVGRGVYALAEWGYTQGTVREILTAILKNAGQPLDRQEILKQIEAIRRVKRSTVIINLNTHFARVGKNAYTVK